MAKVLRVQDNTISAFLALVRAGLWEQDTQYVSLGEIDYSDIIRLAEKQAVIGLVAAGTEHTIDAKIPQEIKIELACYTLRIEQRNKEMNSFINELLCLLQDRGVYAFLLKGQGIAQCYERPLWRSCGDVDLLLSKDNYEAAKRILLPIASSIDDEDEKRKHLALNIGDRVVELHGTLRTNLWKRLENVLDNVQNDVLNGGYVRPWVNGNKQVFLLRTDEDVVFVFAHILQHFFVEGIGMRQICDWCRLLYIYRDSIDRCLLEQRLRSAKLLKKWKVFAAFTVNYLGMPENVMPFYNSSAYFRRKARIVLILVMDSGNFGQGKDKSYKEKYSKGIRYCISFFKHTKDCFRRLCIFPTEAILMWWKLMIPGLIYVFKQNVIQENN